MRFCFFFFFQAMFNQDKSDLSNWSELHVIIDQFPQREDFVNKFSARAQYLNRTVVKTCNQQLRIALTNIVNLNFK